MITLVTGGARSGKSSYAESLLDSASGKVYIATAPVMDEEMRERIRKHQDRRAGKGWRTIEEETDLCRAVHDAGNAPGLLIDCLTLWINNLIYHGVISNETEMKNETEKLLGVLRDFPGHAVLVINEVGLGIVPETASGRLFRDCSGRCAQTIAKQADKVVLLVCGIPVPVKGTL